MTADQKRILFVCHYPKKSQAVVDRLREKFDVHLAGVDAHPEKLPVDAALAVLDKDQNFALIVSGMVMGSRNPEWVGQAATMGEYFLFAAVASGYMGKMVVLERKEGLAECNFDGAVLRLGEWKIPVVDTEQSPEKILGILSDLIEKDAAPEPDPELPGPGPA